MKLQPEAIDLEEHNTNPGCPKITRPLFRAYPVQQLSLQERAIPAHPSKQQQNPQSAAHLFRLELRFC